MQHNACRKTDLAHPGSAAARAALRDHRDALGQRGGRGGGAARILLANVLDWNGGAGGSATALTLVGNALARVSDNRRRRREVNSARHEGLAMTRHRNRHETQAVVIDRSCGRGAH